MKIAFAVPPGTPVPKEAKPIGMNSQFVQQQSTLAGQPPSIMPITLFGYEMDQEAFEAWQNSLQQEPPANNSPGLIRQL